MLASVKTWWSSDNTSAAATDAASPTLTDVVVHTPVNAEQEQEQNAEQQQQSEGSATTTQSDDIAKAVNSAKEWGSYLFTVGKKATQIAAKQVTTTAKQIKHQVEDKVAIEKAPIIGDFAREQSKFIAEHKAKLTTHVAPWVACYSEATPEEEQALREQILALSQDERNFLRNPPAGAQFEYDAEACTPVAMAVLQEDDNLQKMRFQLVPKRVKEDVFWRNYFYRVSLIKQAAQLTSHVRVTGGSGGGGSVGAMRVVVVGDRSSNQQHKGSDTSTESYDRLSDVDGSAGPGRHGNADDGTHDFASDAASATSPSSTTTLTHEERQQLGMVPTSSGPSSQPTDADWEAELQRELSEFELVNPNANTDGSSGMGSGGVATGGPVQVQQVADEDELEREIMAELEQEEKGKQ